MGEKKQLETFITCSKCLINVAIIHIVSPQGKSDNLEGVKTKSETHPKITTNIPKSQYIPLRLSSKDVSFRCYSHKKGNLLYQRADLMDSSRPKSV